jgi:peptidoglycan-N-acetylglucosamine deacetylase
MTFSRFASVLAAISLVLVAGQAQGAPASLLSQCWAPADLAAKPGERKIVKLEGAPDTKPLSRTALPLEPAPFTGSIRSVKIAGGRKLIALTFDLCEAHGQITGYDGDIVDTLRELGANATFFAGGKWLLDHNERAQQLIADSGFELGNHNWSHANERRVSPERTILEIQRTQAAYEAVRDQLGRNRCVASQPAAFSQIPKHIDLYRFPYGACNAAGLKAVAEQGMLEIQWDIAMADPVAAQSADIIVKEVMRKVHPGAIIIGHANGRGVHTNEALQALIPKLRAKGYEFVTVSELLAAGEPVIAQECYNEKPGDLDRYDHPKSDAKKPTDGTSADTSALPVSAKAQGHAAGTVVVKPRGRKRAVKTPAGDDLFSLF